MGLDNLKKNEKKVVKWLSYCSGLSDGQELTRRPNSIRGLLLCNCKDGISHLTSLSVQLPSYSFVQKLGTKNTAMHSQKIATSSKDLCHGLASATQMNGDKVLQCFSSLQWGGITILEEDIEVEPQSPLLFSQSLYCFSLIIHVGICHCVFNF